MKINSDALPRVDSPTTAPSKAEKFLGDTLTARIEQTRGSPSASPLANLAQSVSKADLADPSKADPIIKQAVDEILAKEFGNMSSPDREQVSAWLSKDPVMRAALLKHITSLAS